MDTIDPSIEFIQQKLHVYQYREMLTKWKQCILIYMSWKIYFIESIVVLPVLLLLCRANARN
jgi:hypothetical protein